MTVQVSTHVTAIGKIDAPIFDPLAYRLTDEQAAIITISLTLRFSLILIVDLNISRC